MESSDAPSHARMTSIPCERANSTSSALRAYGTESGGAHDKTCAVDEELFGAGYGFIPDRLEGALGHAFRRQVARKLAVDVPFVQTPA